MSVTRPAARSSASSGPVSRTRRTAAGSPGEGVELPLTQLPPELGLEHRGGDLRRARGARAVTDPVQALVEGPLGGPAASASSTASRTRHLHGAGLRGACAYPGSSRRCSRTTTAPTAAAACRPRAAHGRSGRRAGRALRVTLAARVPQRPVRPPIVPERQPRQLQLLRRAGDHLGLHLDVDTCDVTLITVLHDDTDPRDAGGRARRLSRGARGAAAGGPRGARVGHGARQGAPRPEHRDPRRARPAPGAPARAAGQRIISALCFRADL